MLEPTATWNGARGVWERLETSILCGHPVPFSETWPTSGMTRSGSLYPRPTLERRIAGNGSSSSRGLLPTPLVTNRAGMEPSPATVAGKRGTDLGPAIGALLPTPQAADSQRGAEVEMGGLRPSGAKRSDGLITALLKTPTAQLAVNGGSQHPDKRREGGHGPTLADQVEHLLPTPRATDGTKWGPGQTSTGGPSLPSAVLLPTPDATHGRKTTRTSLLLPGVVEQLLPTPRAADGGPRGSSAGWGLRNTSREISRGGTTNQPSADGKPRSGGQLPGQLSLDEVESG